MIPLVAIPFPVIDPVIFSIGPVSVRWYGLAYVAGILLGWWYLKFLNKKKEVLTPKALDDIIMWSVLGIIIGGRLAYVIFYNLPFYALNPYKIIAVWEGGMSFHGGLAGLVTALYLMARRHNIRFISMMDMVSCVAPIGLCLGRIANFINAELYGTETNVPWAVLFPNHEKPRHPSQIYEALLEGLLLFVILFLVERYTKLRDKPGMLSGIFLIGYAFARSFVENYREPDIQLGYLTYGFTMGQILSIPMFLLGLYLVLWSKKKSNS